MHREYKSNKKNEEAKIITGAIVPRNAQDKLPFAVTPYLLSLIDYQDPSCPIRRQYLPSPQEQEDPHGQDDPLLEQDHSIVPGLIQVYPDRAAWTTSSFCPSL